MGGSCRSESELEIEREKNKEDMQEIRTMIVSMCNKHNDQLADRDREIVKLRDALEGMEIRATKAERQVVRLHSAAKERDTYRSVIIFVMAYAVTSVAISLRLEHSLPPAPRFHQAGSTGDAHDAYQSGMETARWGDSRNHWRAQ